MRTAEECHSSLMMGRNKKENLEAIENIQKEAYNEAIDNAAKIVFSNERPDLAQQHRNYILTLIKQ